MLNLRRPRTKFKSKHVDFCECDDEKRCIGVATRTYTTRKGANQLCGVARHKMQAIAATATPESSQEKTHK